VTPSPEQIQAAMPAMREWIARRVVGQLSRCGPRPSEPALAQARRFWREKAEAHEVLTCVQIYFRPGGVAQFIKDQEERRG